MGSDRSYLADVERGKRNISIVNLELIARGFEVSLSRLLSGYLYNSVGSALEGRPRRNRTALSSQSPKECSQFLRLGRSCFNKVATPDVTRSLWCPNLVDYRARRVLAEFH
jgi:transcriptional regulator with XRE-family HTH domain